MSPSTTFRLMSCILGVLSAIERSFSRRLLRSYLKKAGVASTYVFHVNSLSAHSQRSLEFSSRLNAILVRVPEHSATLFRGHGATPNRSIPPPSFRVGNSSPFSRSKFTVVVRFPENSTSGDQWQQRDWKCVAFGMFCVFILFQHCRRRRLRRLKGAAARLCASTWGGL